MQHAAERVERPGESQEALDRKKSVSALLAWFPASWTSKVAQCFIGDAGGATQLPQEVTIQCPNREAAGTQRRW